VASFTTPPLTYWPQSICQAKKKPWFIEAWCACFLAVTPVHIPQQMMKFTGTCVEFSNVCPHLPHWHISSQKNNFLQVRNDASRPVYTYGMPSKGLSTRLVSACLTRPLGQVVLQIGPAQIEWKFLSTLRCRSVMTPCVIGSRFLRKIGCYLPNCTLLKDMWLKHTVMCKPQMSQSRLLDLI